MLGAMPPQAEADIAPSALTVLYWERVDKCAGFCSSQLERYVPLGQITNRYWDNATRGCLAPQRQPPALDYVRPRAIENVCNSYVLQLSVVISFVRGCYDAQCPRRPTATSATFTICCIAAL